MAEMNVDASSEFPQPDNIDTAARVHFPDEQTVAHDSEIVVQSSGNDLFDVHLGFLQLHHHYNVKFTIKDKLGEDITSDPLQNLNVRLMEAAPSEDGEGHDILLDFKAYKEKLQLDKLILVDANNQLNIVTIKLHARVLGKGKGTPALRRGIHCVGIDVDDDSEQSDWQGFD